MIKLPPVANAFQLETVRQLISEIVLHQRVATMTSPDIFLHFISINQIDT